MLNDIKRFSPSRKTHTDLPQSIANVHESTTLSNATVVEEKPWSRRINAVL